MPYTNNAITAINAAIMTRLSDSRFTKGGIYGLAALMRTEGGNAPALVSHTGNGTFTGFDSAQSIIIYHRALTITGEEAEQSRSFGDSAYQLIDRTRLRCVVYADRERIKMSVVDLASVIISGIRISIAKNATTMPGMNKMHTTDIIAELDPLQVWLAEYAQPINQYCVPPQGAYFAVNYTLNTEYNSSCVEDCTTC
jgi:hypothetical protein